MNQTTDRMNFVKQNSLPEELKRLNQWVCWKLGERRSNGKYAKLLINPHTGSNAKVNNPQTWGTFDQACQYYLKNSQICGVGFVFVKGYVGIDLDDCFLENGHLKPAAAQIVGMIDSYAETSQSGQGLHIITEGKKTTEISKLNTGEGAEKFEIECYETGRFFALTGNVYANRTLLKQVDLRPFCQLLEKLKQQSMTHAAGSKVSSGSKSGENPQLDDAALIQKAMSAHDGESFRRLWAGDMTGFESQSQADWVLCRKLAFWANTDAERIDRLFRQSGLMRSKWDARHAADGATYGQITIQRAISKTQTTYAPASPTRPPHPAAAQEVKQPVVLQVASDDATDTRGVLPVAEGAEDIAEFVAEIKEINQDIDVITHTTDFGNARRLVHHYGDKIRFCVDQGVWYVWNKRRWQAEHRNNPKVVKLAKKTVKKIYGECAAIEDIAERTARAKWAHKSEEKKRITDMIFLAQSEEEVEIETAQLDADPYLLNCKNGVVDLKTGELRPHNPADYLTKMVPIEYDSKALCPLWERAVLKYMGFEEGNKEKEKSALRMYEFLQRAVGYSLTADSSEQCFFFLYGDGKNGKSTFVNTISRLFGDYFQHVRIESLLAKSNDAIPNDIATLPGARLVVCSEIPEGRRMNETLVKDLTGGDAITARFLHQEFFTFHPVFKLWIFGNDKPIVSPSDAMFRRVKMIPFNVQIPEAERDPHFEEKLAAELPGILAWAVTGCALWLQEQGLKPPQEIVDATNTYRDEMDVLADFIEECCFMLPSAKVTMKDLYEEFQRWSNAIGKTPLSKPNFNKRLEKRLGDKLSKGITHGNKTTWLGLGLLSEQQTNLDSITAKNS